MTTSATFGRTLFRFRSFTPVPVIAVLIVLLASSRGQSGPGGAQWDQVLNVLGLLVALAGQALRFYTLSLVPEGTSGQGSVLEAKVLNTQGPYSYVRNPLYVGNLGICLGLLLIANNLWVSFIALAFFFGEYYFIIRAEEDFLRHQHGAAFDAFVAKVPRWIPRFTGAFDGKLRETMNLRRGLKKEHNPFAAWACGALGLWAWEQSARGQLTTGAAWAVAAAFAVVLTGFAVIKGLKHGWIPGWK